jgi:hypothetical protein
MSGAISIGGPAIASMTRNGLAGLAGNSVGQLAGGSVEQFSFGEAAMQAVVGSVSGTWERAAGFMHGLALLKNGATAQQAISSSFAVGSVHAVGATGLQNLALPSNLGGVGQGAGTVDCGCKK